jgi:peptide/nickel transport system substrate-binding protein
MSCRAENDRIKRRSEKTMTPISRRLRLLALASVVAIVAAACSSSATTAPTAAPATAAPVTAAPATAAPATAAPATEAPATAAPFAPMTYPSTGEVTCASGGAAGSFNGKDYTGEIKSIKSIDAKTVEFTLCTPDVAFLQKVAMAMFPINDSAYLEKAAPDGTIVQQPNGTGPYMVKEWVKGDHITLVANPLYWGPNKPKVATVIIKWSAEAAQRLVELQSGNVDGIDNVGPTDFATVKSDTTLKLIPRTALNIFYIGMSNAYPPFDNEMVRQAVAQGIDRDRIVKNFYPEGSTVADYFTPCDIPGGCQGDPWYKFDAVAAKALLAKAGFPNGFKTKIHLRDVVRGYLPNPTQVATDIQAQLKANLNIDATIDVQESGTYIDNASSGKLDGIHLLGWGADYPDVTNFLDYHFGGGASPQFGAHYADIVAALQKGATNPDQAARNAAYAEANNLIKQHVPMVPVAHGGSAVAFKADVDGAHSSPLSDEYFAVMKAADRTQLVWTQNGEPAGLYCADEEDGEAIRVCDQINEALYSFKIGGTDTEPALAKECKPNADLTVWTCTLQDNVKFADGSDLDANDVVVSYAAMWDAANPLHKARTGNFTYFSALWGGFLNPPPAQ